MPWKLPRVGVTVFFVYSHVDGCCPQTDVKGRGAWLFRQIKLTIEDIFYLVDSVGLLMSAFDGQNQFHCIHHFTPAFHSSMHGRV